MKNPHKALALMSGGLDSLLAAKVILDQGVLVEGINFFTGFTPSTHLMGKVDQKVKSNRLEKIENQLGISIHRVNIIEEYKSVVLHPKYGYGSKHINPCLDCKILMVRKALEWAMQHGFDFMITGEVIGQRPMTQRRDTLHIVARDSSAKDRILRPLCAKCLPETLPEREKWVDRNRLYGFNGRSRKPQIALAKQLGLEDFPAPGNDCCFLIDPNFAKRWLDFKQYHCDYTMDDIARLKVGRHIRLNERCKIIMGRDESENDFLERYTDRLISMYAIDFTGPLVLLEGKPTEEDLEQAASLTAQFGHGRDQDQVRVKIEKPGQEDEVLIVELSSDDR
jgi:tRNA U34 2-thiouridine synthase MnmA/TrmU